jgi:polysaccharide deacetylase 2 family uncharacterized protein YibQ
MRRRSTFSSTAIVVAVVIAAAIAGCSLLRPAHRTATPAPSSRTPGAATPSEAAAPVTPSAASTSERSRGAATSEPNAPKLALIVDDCGQWLDTERGFIALSIPLTMSVLPDVPYTSTIAREAADAGKGVMLHLPMETVSGMNPGPGKVTTEMSDDQIRAQVDDDLAQVPLAQGVNNHEGSKGSADARLMRDVVDVIAKHGNLFFVDSKTASNSVAEQIAESAGVPTAARDVFLDNQADLNYTEGQLRAAAAIAKRTGSAIAIGHPRPTTLAAIKALIPELQSEGIEFVLVRDLTRESPAH